MHRQGVLVFAGLLIAVGCFLPSAVHAQETAGIQPAKLIDSAIGEAATTYSLGKGDVVEITVRNQPEFSGAYPVGPDGKIQYNFLGDLQAEGLTKEDLKTAIEGKISRYVKGADVSVVIAAYRSKFVYIMGEVGQPGKYPMKGDQVSLRDAIMAAGLPTRAAALRRAYVIKPDEHSPATRKVDLYRLLYKGILKADIVLAPGDLVVVPSTVPSEINRALTNLLSPISQGVNAAATYETLTR